MDDLPRLKWSNGGRGYLAFPAGTHVSGRNAEVFLQTSGWNTDRTPHAYVESWCWVVRWEGWFAHHGFAESKQAAADKATEKWWKAIQTELPRNVDLEVEIIVARVLICPPPNSLFMEDVPFLQKVLWHLNNNFRDEVKRDTAPASVKELMSRISDELYSRRLAEPQPAPVAEPAVSGGYRRRRRR